MAAMKAFAEQVSEDMGLDGEITEAVLVAAQLRLDTLLIDRQLEQLAADWELPETEPPQEPHAPEAATNGRSCRI